MNSRSHVTAVTRVNSSALFVCLSSVAESRATSTRRRRKLPEPSASASPSPSNAALISVRNVRRHPSACARISRFGSESIRSSPSKNAGSNESASTCGVASSATIHPIRNWRAYGSRDEAYVA